ncbi:hypothetical protein [Microbacterium sp. B19]|uniref:hypothetical protein n=1 Tax=Microbacterium sp. B19 TaxID=96765 RepID=UPI000345E62B|nr:hypothetical protein [Microbacterium sp. B19]
MTSTVPPLRRPSPAARAARKDRVLTWVTLSIVAVICLVLGFGAVAMANSWWTEETPVASADQQLADGQSRFDRAGLDFLNRQGHATVDVTASTSASELGLPTSGQTPIDTLVPISLEVRGDGTSVKFSGLSHFELTTSDDILTRVQVIPAASGSWASISSELGSRAAQWGWSQAQLDALHEQVGDAARNEGTTSTLSLPTVTYGGMSITAQVTSSDGTLSLAYNIGQ